MLTPSTPPPSPRPRPHQSIYTPKDIRDVAEELRCRYPNAKFLHPLVAKPPRVLPGTAGGGRWLAVQCSGCSGWLDLQDFNVLCTHQVGSQQLVDGGGWGAGA